MSTSSTGLAPTTELNDAISQQEEASMLNAPQPPANGSNIPAPPRPPLSPPKSTTSQTFVRQRSPLLNLPLLNLPCEDLVVGIGEYNNICVPLYEASISGDWEAAKLILRKRPELVRYSITDNGETALHIATSARNIKFVEALVGFMEKKDLELQSKSGNTALCLAAAAGNLHLTKIMLNKNKSLIDIPGSQEMMPLYMAALYGNHETVNYLYDISRKMSGDFWTPQNRSWVVLKCIEADLFDIALKILVDLPELAQNGSFLGVLARKPYAFEDKRPHFLQKFINSILEAVHVKRGLTEKGSEAMELLKLIWKNIMELPRNEVDNLLRGPKDTTVIDGKFTMQLKKDGSPKYSSRILFVAAELGNTKFVVELIRRYSDLIWKVNDKNQSIFHVAVSHRHESIYNLLYEIGSMKDQITPLKDTEGNNMLHLLGKSAKKNKIHASRVAFQMQREYMWFKEVEAMIPPTYRERKNNAGLKPRELFTQNHNELVLVGEAWMKETATQCMVVASLIATIVFGVAVAIPGGYNQNTGLPMFVRKKIFIVFVISDAISLLLASASILVFLSIITSSYSEEDFLESLPRKLMLGLATLFTSVMTMMVAFSFSLFVLYSDNLIWVPIVICVLAAIPVILFAKLQYPLLMDIYGSNFGSKYVFKPKKHMLYGIIRRI